VRPDKSHIYTGHQGRRIAHFETLDGALTFVEARSNQEQLIFLHTGRHTPPLVVINSGVHIIGASKLILCVGMSVFTSLFKATVNQPI
jgi:hypothetical protein